MHEPPRAAAADVTVTERAGPAVTIALVAGMCGAVQPKINAVLGDRVGSALVASFVNFTGALTVVVVAIALRPATRRRVAGIRDWPVPRWTFLAGLGGATVVVAGAVTVETIGVAVFSVAFFAGQIASGLLVDGLGVGPGGKRPITAARVQAVLLAVVAVVVSQLAEPVGDVAPALVALVVVAGAAVALQSACNARIVVALGDPVTATAVNVTVGASALAAVLGLVAATAGFGPLQWPSEPWLYTGGLLGVTIVLSLAVATAALGVLRGTLAMLSAQLIAAFLVDWLVRDEPPTLGASVGGLLIVAAVAVVGRRPTPVRAPAT